MPGITPQRVVASGRPTVKAKPGSILARAVPVSEIGDEPLHAILYGKNRTGKTTLACQFPKPLLLISVEPTKTGGAQSVRSVPGVSHIKLSASAEIEAAGHELTKDCGYVTAVLDGPSSMDEVVLAEICGWDQTINMNRFGKVNQDQYTERSERMRKILRPFLDSPINVIFCCNEKDYNPPEGRKSALVRGPHTESHIAAAMGGGTTRWLQEGCEIWHLYRDREIITRTNKVTVGSGKSAVTEDVVEEIDTGKIVRRLRLQFHTNYSAGVRADLGKVGTVPEFIQANMAIKDEQQSRDMYVKLMAVYGRKP